MNSNKEFIEDYISLLRDSVNFFLNKAMGNAEKNNEKFVTRMKKLLCFSKDEDWSILTSSLDLAGDTTLAIENFNRFGLAGPTKYWNNGENYLRLYGVLNAAYLLNSSIIQLATIFKINDKNKVASQLTGHQFIELRNIAGSHTAGFNDIKNKKVKYFKIARYSIDMDECIEIFDEKNNITKFNLKELIKDYQKNVVEILDQIAEKAISTLYKNNSNQKKELTEELEMIRKKRDGHIIIKISGFKENKKQKAEV